LTHNLIAKIVPIFADHALKEWFSAAIATATAVAIRLSFLGRDQRSRAGKGSQLTRFSARPADAVRIARSLSSPQVPRIASQRRHLIGLSSSILLGRLIAGLAHAAHRKWLKANSTQWHSLRPDRVLKRHSTAFKPFGSVRLAIHTEHGPLIQFGLPTSTSI
jgi:hypothetical protein